MSSEGGAKKRGRRVSIASKDVLDIQPVVYSFKGPANGHAPGGSVVSAVQPPHWLYHDHVMGVIWMIFHKEKNYVGISQLQWCLRFLVDLKNSQGEYTGDVEICIRAIQDDLIEQYASLGPALDRSTAEKSQLTGRKSSEASRNRTNEPIRDETDETENESNGPGHPDLVGSKSDNNDNRDEDQEEFFTARSQGIAGTSTPNEEEPRPSRSNGGESKQDSENRCGLRCRAKDGAKRREEILSFTYDEMMARGPAPCTAPASLVEDTYSGKLIEYSGEKSQFGQFADLYSSELVNFLNSSKQQHEAGVNREMETLRMLERLMENLNIEGLSTNLARDSSRRQENSQKEDSGKEAEETKLIVD